MEFALLNYKYKLIFTKRYFFFIHLTILFVFCNNHFLKNPQFKMYFV